jgi:hypothetical protein
MRAVDAQPGPVEPTHRSQGPDGFIVALVDWTTSVERSKWRTRGHAADAWVAIPASLLALRL